MTTTQNHRNKTTFGWAVAISKHFPLKIDLFHLKITSDWLTFNSLVSMWQSSVKPNTVFKGRNDKFPIKDVSVFITRDGCRVVMSSTEGTVDHHLHSCYIRWLQTDLAYCILLKHCRWRCQFPVLSAAMKSFNKSMYFMYCNHNFAVLDWDESLSFTCCRL